MASLHVWMNGEMVGEWATLRGGTALFRYAPSWAESPRARALSLSLPLTADLELRGTSVENYFDNLLPDSPKIRRRIRERFQTASSNTFDLLTAIGRDCVGAVQLLPPGEAPDGWNRVDAEMLNEASVERALRAITSATPIGHDEAAEFRISLAGAQEKTALLGMAGKWFRPLHATPTTHILKLPLGVVGGFQGDFSDSVENEWLCGQILHAMKLPVAATAIANFGEQQVLVVTRFDRRWIGIADGAEQRRRFAPADGTWIARLPQEDFCQATGRPSNAKYEADGGPSISECLGILATSEHSLRDRTHFVLAQLTFWLLAATDGHAKNFSIRQEAGGAFALTPFYDVLSAWPIVGRGKNQLPIEKAKLAMAVRGKSAHYRINEIQPRSWRALAENTGIPNLWSTMQTHVENIGPAIDSLEGTLPSAFPERVFTMIRDGVRRQVRSFQAAAGSS
jgi:serine/threonine-protein kinase HipA